MGYLEKAFWGNVTRASDQVCWLWEGKTTEAGYGYLTIDTAARVYAHRLAWLVGHGEWPSHHVLHACDVRNCVNFVSHLSVGTHAENMKDKQLKGRAAFKLTRDQVLEAMELRKSGALLRELADRYDVSTSTMGKILQGKSWSHVTENYDSGIKRAGNPHKGEDHPMSKITESQAVAIRSDYAAGLRRADLETKYGISKSQVQRIVTGESWLHI